MSLCSSLLFLGFDHFDSINRSQPVKELYWLSKCSHWITKVYRLLIFNKNNDASSFFLFKFTPPKVNISVLVILPPFPPSTTVSTFLFQATPYSYHQQPSTLFIFSIIYFPQRQQPSTIFLFLNPPTLPPPLSNVDVIWMTPYKNYLITNTKQEQTTPFQPQPVNTSCANL